MQILYLIKSINNIVLKYTKVSKVNVQTLIKVLYCDYRTILFNSANITHLYTQEYLIVVVHNCGASYRHLI